MTSQQGSTQFKPPSPKCASNNLTKCPLPEGQRFHTQGKRGGWEKTRRRQEWFCGMISLTLYENWIADSGGYTIKCLNVKPKPWDVLFNITVLGPGQENVSSSDGDTVSLCSFPSLVFDT